jgi:hypothetical protein
MLCDDFARVAWWSEWSESVLTLPTDDGTAVERAVRD